MDPLWGGPCLFAGKRRAHKPKEKYSGHRPGVLDKQWSTGATQSSWECALNLRLLEQSEGFLQMPVWPECLALVTQALGSQFPLREYEIPRPRKSRKLIKNYNLAYPGDCPESYRKFYSKISENLLKCNFVCNLFWGVIFSAIFRTVAGWAKL